MSGVTEQQQIPTQEVLSRFSSQNGRSIQNLNNPVQLRRNYISSNSYKLTLKDYPKVQPTYFLREGTVFDGYQQDKSTDPKQRIQIRITTYDAIHGEIKGTLEVDLSQKSNTNPNLNHKLVTFFVGEIIDNHHHNFFSNSFGVSKSGDLKVWSQMEDFKGLEDGVRRNFGCDPQLGTSSKVFIRIKERFIVKNDSDSLFSIDGFYNLCLDRHSGKMAGFYVDQFCSLQHELQVEVTEQKLQGGVSFGRSQIC